MNLQEWLFQPSGPDGYIDGPDATFKVGELIALFENWREVMAGLPSEVHSVYAWRLICEPLWVGDTYAGNKRIGLKKRCALVQSMKQVTLAIPDLHASDEPMGSGYYMWWDVVAPALVDDSSRQVCLEVLTELTNHLDIRVQAAALHGLGHLFWPGTGDAVQAFIDSHPTTTHNREWLEQCRNGSVI